MSKPINPVEKFFIRYNLVLFVVAAAAVLSATIYLCYTTYLNISSSETNNTTSSIPTTFDQKTQAKIDDLHKSNDPNISVERPAGRINPFSE